MMKKKFKLTYNAPVILSFVIICFVATVLGIVTNDKSTELLFSAYRSSFSNPLTYVRLIGHAFGHVGLDHFIGNAMLLLLLGPMLEEKYGSASLIKVIVITALFTGIIHCLLWNNVALCGASGIVFACIILSSFTTFKEGEVPLTFVLVSVMYIGKEFYSGILIQDSVSNLTHILGGVVGSISGYLLNRKQHLKESGLACFNGHEMTGITNMARVDVEKVTRTQKEYNPSVPDTWYVVEETNIDGIVVWQSATGEVFQTAPGSTAIRIADNLTEYISK